VIIGSSLSVQHADDAGEILGTIAAVDEQVEQLGGSAPRGGPYLAPAAFAACWANIRSFSIIAAVKPAW